MQYWILGVVGLFVWMGCKTKKEEHVEAIQLVTNLDGVWLREASSEDAKVVRQLPKGTILYDLGEVSDFTTRVQLRGIQFDEPWLRVRTEDGASGWIYGGALNFTRSDSSQLAKIWIEKRLRSLFGQTLANRIRGYRHQFQSMKSAGDFANVYRSGTALRDTMVYLMQDRIVVSDPNDLPDLFWLEQAMPGFVSQLVAEGTAYYLFWDYKRLASKVKVSSNTADDDFVKLAMAIFPEDSVEFFYPVWFLQTWDDGGSSLLGRGFHQETLRKLEATLQKSGFFAPEIMHWKSLLVNDITDSNVTYWETKEKITAELDNIIHQDYAVLTNTDKIALQTRRKQFENIVANKIQLNQQAGN